MTLTLVDAARFAQNLHSQHPELFVKGQPDPMRVDVRALRLLTEKKIGRPITLELANDEQGLMNGLVLDLAEKAVVLISQRHADNPCWCRMTATKEIVHLYNGLLLDGGNSLNLDIIAARDCRIDIPAIDQELHQEKFCFFAAIEILLPQFLRGELSDAHHVHQLSPNKIATQCRVPQTIITYYFERHYAECSLEANRIAAAR